MLLSATTAASVGVGALIGWAAGSVGYGILGGAIVGVPAGIAAVRLGLPASSARCAQVPAAVANAPFVRRAHRLGLPVHAWTVNERALMESLLDLGVDGIITDYPDRLREVMAEKKMQLP